MRSTRTGLAPAFICSLLLALATAPASLADSGCSKVASPSGADSAAGTEAAPFATAQKLSDSLQPGEVGCLRAGTYTEDLRVGTGGTPGAPVTLRSYPGERAKLVGRLWVARGADNVTISYLDLDGKNADVLPSPTVNAADTVFDHVDVSNENTEICFNLGSDSYGTAVRTIIQNSRIHNCGRLPAANHDHGIYIVAGRDIVIRGNVIYSNADRGVQLYPDAQRTTITGNVIDGNGQGVIFSGAGGVSSNDNVVRNNVITNSNVRHNVESFYPDDTPSGTGNVVTDNCVYGGTYGNENGGVANYDGYTATANTVADPQYADRARGDFRLPAGSRCAALLGDQLSPTVAAGTDSPAPLAVAADTVATAVAAALPTAAPAAAPVPAPAPSTDRVVQTAPRKTAGRSQSRTAKTRRVVAFAAVVQRSRSCRVARSSSRSFRVRARARVRCVVLTTRARHLQQRQRQARRMQQQLRAWHRHQDQLRARRMQELARHAQ